MNAPRDARLAALRAEVPRGLRAKVARGLRGARVDRDLSHVDRSASNSCRVPARGTHVFARRARRFVTEDFRKKKTLGRARAHT
jgi:hypothetical protein